MEPFPSYWPYPGQSPQSNPLPRTLVIGRRDRPLRWPTHAPGAVLDYSIDLSAEMTADTDTVASVTMTSGGDLVLSKTSVTPTIATLWLGGGGAGTDYVVTVAITTAAGRVYVFAVMLFCGVGVMSSAPVYQLLNAEFAAPLTVVNGQITILLAGLSALLQTYPSVDPGDGSPYWNGGILAKGNPV